MTIPSRVHLSSQRAVFCVPINDSLRLNTKKFYLGVNNLNFPRSHTGHFSLSAEAIMSIIIILSSLAIRIAFRRHRSVSAIPRCRAYGCGRTGVHVYAVSHVWSALPRSLHNNTDSKQIRKQLKTYHYLQSSNVMHACHAWTIQCGR